MRTGRIRSPPPSILLPPGLSLAGLAGVADRRDARALHLFGDRFGFGLAGQVVGLEMRLARLEQGDIGALEAIDALLAEELDVRENRRIGVALKTARLTPPKTLERFDFSFQPSLDRDRILALAQLDFVDRAEVVHLLGPPGPGP